MPRNPATICVSNTVAGHSAAGRQKHVEVLGCGVRDCDARAPEDRGQRGGVDGERVDESHSVLPGDLISARSGT